MHAAGQILKDAREAKGVSRAVVARATGIHAHHIAAIEFGNIDELPGRETVERWLRAYADYLALDPSAVVAGFFEPPAPNVEPTPSQAAQPTRTWLRVAPLAAAVLIVGALGWWALSDGPPRTRSQSSAPPPEAAPIVGTVEDTEAPPDPVPLETVPPALEVDVADAAPAVEPPPVVTAGRITIAEHAVGTDIVDRRLVGKADSFPAGSRVTFWTDVRGGRAGDAIRHVWLHEGRVIDEIELSIGGARWRTHSRKTIAASRPGTWAVEARDASGAVLARAEFVAR